MDGHGSTRRFSRLCEGAYKLTNFRGFLYEYPGVYFQNRREVSCSKRDEQSAVPMKHNAMLKGRFALYLLEECTYYFTVVPIKKRGRFALYLLEECTYYFTVVPIKKR
jgi:hypothetical protein